MRCYTCRGPVTEDDLKVTCEAIANDETDDLTEVLNLVHCTGPDDLFHHCLHDEGSEYDGVCNVCKKCLEAAQQGGEEDVNRRIHEMLQ